MSIEKKPKNLISARTFLERKDGYLTLGTALQSERLCRDMTLTDFADILDISVQQLSDIEKGRRFVSPDKAAQFAKKLGDSAALYIELSLQDSMKRSGLKFRIRVEAA